MSLKQRLQKLEGNRANKPGITWDTFCQASLDETLGLELEDSPALRKVAACPEMMAALEEAAQERPDPVEQKLASLTTRGDIHDEF